MQETTRRGALALAGRSLAGLTLAAATLPVAPVAPVTHAQEAPPADDAAPMDPPAPDAPAEQDAPPAPAAPPALFVQVVDPADVDVEVALETASITLSGLTVPGAVVSVDGNLAGVADDGSFSANVDLDEGANEIPVVASDADGNEVEQTLYVVRG